MKLLLLSLCTASALVVKHEPLKPALKVRNTGITRATQ